MNRSKTINWILRLAIAGEFAGHGMLAVLGNPQWVGWIQKFGISDAGLAAKLLLAVGIVDLMLAFVVLVRPIKPLLLWMAVWGLWTALLRPLMGLAIWDFIERFANWGAPLAFYFILKDEESRRG